MKNQTKRVLSFIASACLVATSLSAFGISAENQPNDVEVSSAVTEEVKSTTEAEKEVKSTTKAEKEVKSTTKSIAVAKDSEDTVVTTITSGANGTTVVNTNGTTVNTTIAGTTAIDGADYTTTTTTAIDGAKYTTTTDNTDLTTTAIDGAKYTTTTAIDNADVTTTGKASLATSSGSVTATFTTNNTNVTTTFENVTDITTSPEYTHSNDVILTLDTSKSMEGQPLELVKKTAIDLVNKILDEDPNAQISIVEMQNLSGGSLFADDDDNVSFYTNDRDALIDIITAFIDNKIEREDYDVDGSTDILDALEQIKFILDDGTGETKSIVIMTDGVNGTNCVDDETGEIFYDVPDEVAISKEFAEKYKDTILDYANEYIKPFATIYTIGYLQNLENGEEAAKSRDFLMDLASDGVEGAKYYEANEKNIDEITDLITHDIIYDAPPTKKDDTTKTTTTVADKDANSPKTGDTGVTSVLVLGGLACALVVTSKKKVD